MTKDQEIRELRAMLNTAISNLNLQHDLMAENIQVYRKFFDRTSFHLTRQPIAEYVEGEVKKEKARKKRFYPGYPGIAQRVLDPDKIPFQQPRKRNKKT